MNSGAHRVIATLLANRVDTCFANPGTSEMHFVTALRDYPEMKSVLCLFEGVATGAADGYARMACKPAATLLHLGPGLANGLANLHNAKKAHSAMINIIGDHATFHKSLDAPLNSDIEATAAPYSHFVHTSRSVEAVSRDTGKAVAAANSLGGQIAALVLPADVAWSEAKGDIHASCAIAPAKTEEERITQAAAILNDSKKVGLIIGGEACFGEGLISAGKIAAAAGATLLAPYSCARLERGKESPPVSRIPFPVEAAVSLLRPFDELILIGIEEPVAFFAYPGLPSRVVSPQTRVSELVNTSGDVMHALSRLGQELGADTTQLPVNYPDLPPAPEGKLNVDRFCQVIARNLKKDMILVDEGVTSSRSVFDKSLGADRHDLLVNVGGAIGAGLPLALGAAIACPQRPVLCISGDGSAAYTLQALWSIAQQNLNITVVICANNTYEILHGEMVRVGAVCGSNNPQPLLDLINPEIDWLKLATGFGVQARRVHSCEELENALMESISSVGPNLIEVPLEIDRLHNRTGLMKEN